LRSVPEIVGDAVFPDDVPRALQERLVVTHLALAFVAACRGPSTSIRPGSSS